VKEGQNMLGRKTQVGRGSDGYILRLRDEAEAEYCTIAGKAAARSEAENRSP
jgi:hypothetical protein